MNYSLYKLTIKEYLYGGCIFAAVAYLMSYLFYDSVIPLLILLPCVIFFYKYMRQSLKKKRDRVITTAFKDMLISISSLLSTGHSLENAISEAKKEIFSLHGNCIIYEELVLIEKRLHLNIPIETAFSDFALRTDIEIIHTFSEILSIAKQSGGDLRAVILSTTSNISSQVDIRMEIATHLAGQKLELYIMTAMPPIIMIYIKLTNNGFFNSVYHNFLGIIVMTICLIIYIASVFLAYKIISTTE